MSNELRVYLESGAKDGWCHLHCPDLPGLGFKAPSPEAATALAPFRLEAELDWARKVGLALPLDGTPKLTVVGAVKVEVPVAAGDTEAIFGPEMTGVDADYLAFAMNYLKAARKPLLSLCERLPASVMAWRPAKGKRSIEEVLGHVADAEAFYLVRLEAPEAATRELWTEYALPKSPPAARLEWVRNKTIERLENLSKDDCFRVSRHDPHTETWTARKVLRRMIWHDRYHTRQIDAYLTS